MQDRALRVASLAGSSSTTPPLWRRWTPSASVQANTSLETERSAKQRPSLPLGPAWLPWACRSRRNPRRRPHALVPRCAASAGSAPDETMPH